MSEELEVIHVTRLREFCFDDRFVDPRDVALRYVKECYVERILAHSCSSILYWERRPDALVIPKIT